jgi:predicted dehydrogenase
MDKKEFGAMPDLKIGILGMTEGNGHPYSWSAMFNGYNKDYMDECPFEVIPEYLYKQPESTFGIEGTKITHICCTGYANREEAEKIAKASKIPFVTDCPEDMIGEVDAVICATDVGSEHVARCAPFLEAGTPMFIDKPLVDCEEDLKTFLRWRKEGKRFISCSSLRYSKALEPFHKNHYEFGKLMYICQPMPKKLETYGIHALESVYPILGKGFLSVQNTGTYERTMLHIVHENGCHVHIPQGLGMSGTGTLIVGSHGSQYIKGEDSYYSFKKQLDLFVHWLKTGEEPFDFAETIELMKLVIGGIKSREEGGRKVYLTEIEV